jgi:DNA invertase Pin-like site-specific DNA recombinase
MDFLGVLSGEGLRSHSPRLFVQVSHMRIADCTCPDRVLGQRGWSGLSSRFHRLTGCDTRPATTEAFVVEHGLHTASNVENESGAKLARPELFRLLSDARPGDILLIEQVDRLSRLTGSDWKKLKAELAARHARVVALDLPTSWMMANSKADDFTARMFDAINGMMLDMLAAVARKDYEDRRRRQNQGQARAKAEGLYKPKRGCRPQRRHCCNAQGRFIMVANSGCYWVQPGYHRQDRETDGDSDTEQTLP